jgi:hypothetical protein
VKSRALTTKIDAEAMASTVLDPAMDGLELIQILILMRFSTNFTGVGSENVVEMKILKMRFQSSQYSGSLVC